MGGNSKERKSADKSDNRASGRTAGGNRARKGAHRDTAEAARTGTPGQEHSTTWGRKAGSSKGGTTF
ncbi:hypothetical protein TcasGA2_TC012699 [Tribolium castaneum]|uniref:Uncharacterized protein n=1 Tax=Tribolium castaneum TaxID=7070 RepID=D6WZN8_TRICA|nr:hypothetical protein TcasGA2_TC012699 [Tribolium castaneum]